MAPASFGAAAGDLLVGIFGDGTINAYDPVSGALIGTLADLSSALLVNNGLWGLIVGNGGNGGSVNSLYITVGGSDEASGRLARIYAVPEPALAWLAGAGVMALALGRRVQARRATR
jgi:uncharacterized protein (TIGR03118 family)